MNWAQVVFPLVLGLVLAKAEDILNLGDRVLEKVSQTDNRLYMQFACRGKPNGLRLPIAGSCVNYYECKQGMTVRKTCREGFHFSNLALSCLEERLSKCEPEQSTESSVKCEGLCCGRQDGLYPAKNSCSDYSVCVNEQIFQRSCGKGLKFSAHNLVCDIPDRAMCNVDDSIENVHEDKLEREEEEKEEADSPEQGYSLKPTMYMVSHRICRLHPTGFTIGIPGSCNKFYLCIEGVGYLKSCGNMQFNIEEHYCDARTRIYCPIIEQDDVILQDDEYLPIRPLPIPFEPQETDEGKHLDSVVEKEEEIEPQPIEKPVKHEKEEKTEKLSKEEKKKQSWHFVETRPTPPVIDDDDEEEQEVPARPKPKKPSPTPPIAHKIPPTLDTFLEKEIEVAPASKNICANQPVGALIALPDDCNKYIRCRWDWYQRRAAEVMSCPRGMHFNSSSKHCDRPENAGCEIKPEKTNEGKSHRKFSKVL